MKDYKGGTVGAAGEAFDPSPANLDARHQGRGRWAASRPACLPKKNRGETVSLVLTLHYGNEESLKGQTTAAGMLPGLMMAGTKKHDRQALREELDTLGIRISRAWAAAVGGGRRGGGGGGGGAAGQLTFSVEAKRDTLPQALELLGEILREPAFPEAEFETPKRRMRSAARRRPHRARRPGRPTSSAAPCRPYPKDDVRYVPTSRRIGRARSRHARPGQGALRDQVGGVARRAGRRRRLRPGRRRWPRSARCCRAGSRRCRSSGSTARPPADRDRVEGRHRHAGQGERRVPRRAGVPAEGHRPGVRGPADRQLHLRRQHAVLAARRPHPPEGGAVVRRHLVVHGLAARPGRHASRSPPSPTRRTSTRWRRRSSRNWRSSSKNGPTETEVADAKKAYLERRRWAARPTRRLPGRSCTNLIPRPRPSPTPPTRKSGSRPDAGRDRGRVRKHIDPKKLVDHPGGRFQEVGKGESGRVGGKLARANCSPPGRSPPGADATGLAFARVQDFFENEIHDPAPAHVRPVAAAVPDNLLVLAPGVHRARRPGSAFARTPCRRRCPGQADHVGGPPRGRRRRGRRGCRRCRVEPGDWRASCSRPASCEASRRRSTLPGFLDGPAFR